MRALRKSLVIGMVVVLVAVVFIVTVPSQVSAISHTWTTDADWNSGNQTNLQVIGTGASSSLILAKSPIPDWQRMAPATVPPARGDYCLAWEDYDNAFIMFGGKGTGKTFGDTWKYNFTNDQWTQLFPSTSPSNRSKMGCAYDTVNRVVVMFGGADASGNWLSETWHFNVVTGNWEQIFPTSLTPRNHLATPMTYDVQDRKILMETAITAPEAMQTWAYDVTTRNWTNRAATGQPEQRDGFKIAYDKNVNKVLLYAGAWNLTLYCDFWWYTYSTNAWNKIDNCVINRDPMPGRVDYGLAYSEAYLGTVLYGGYTDVAYPPGTWYFLGSAGMWVQPPVPTSPGGQRYINLADDSIDQALMFFGGYNSGTSPPYQNSTWVLAKGYISGTVGGQWTSNYTPVDTGCSNPVYNNIFFNATKPATTVVRFQIATSNSVQGPWTFVGPPSGLPGQYYQTDGQAIWQGHNGQRYFRVLAQLKTGNGRVTPTLNDVSVDWSCPPTPPFITNTNPVNGRQNAPIDQPIWVNFSEAMNTSTVTYTITPSTTVNTEWSNADSTLALVPTSPLRDCTNYTVQITGGKDQNEGLDLVPGPAPNPWTFKTVCINPYVLRTDPPDGGFNVPLDKVINVTFSEPMQTATVTYTISPGLGLTAGWNGNRDVLSLSHTTAFAQCTVYTVQITAGLDDQSLPLGPGPVPHPWSFFSSCPNPTIVSTDPADGATGVAVNKVVNVTFSKSMTPGTVVVTITGGIALTKSWNSPTNTIMSLSHAAPFAELANYTVQVTAGTDTGGLPIVPGIVPNPWSFETAGVNPFIVNTTPYNNERNVPLGTPIVVTFSEPMNTPTVSVTLSPSLGVSFSWNTPTNTVLTLAHGTPFAQCTVYTVTIAGHDMQGLPLVPGPVPNPWSFRSACPLGAPGGLAVTKVLPSNVVLSWRAVTGATGYKVYTSQNRFAAWSTWTLLGTVTTPTYTHAVLTDGLTHYYIVRATDGTQDGPNSTMGVKTQLSFSLGTTNTNIAWFSLPYVSQYHRASDIATELGPSNINVIGKWNPSTQSSSVYYYSRGRWRGADFTIGGGDGLYLGVAGSFPWVVVGTDANVTLSFTYNSPPKGNTNWLSLPYTGTYQRASDVANALGSSKVTEIGLWDPATQASVRWYWTGSAWTGTDFTFGPGAGVYIIIASSFQWNPTLITPAVP